VPAPFPLRGDFERTDLVLTAEWWQEAGNFLSNPVNQSLLLAYLRDSSFRAHRK
jgi:hypothetical protein